MKVLEWPADTYGCESWIFEMEWDITTSMSTLTVESMPLYRVKIS